MCRKAAYGLVVLLALLLMVAAVAPGQAADQPARFGPLLGRVPAGANTLIMLDVKAIRSSLFVTNTPASEKNIRAQVSRYVFGSKELDRAVLAADLNLASIAPNWQAAIVETNVDTVLADVAQRQNGRVEQLGSMQAAWVPMNAYVVPFTSRLVGIRYPADRQFAASWANHPALPDTNALSPYLRQAAAYPETVGTEIIMALDLENAADPGLVRQNLENTQAVKGKDVDLDQLARVLASVRGVTLGIRVTTNVTGSLRIDFSEDVTMTADYAKALILEKLARFGASIDEFYDWDLRVAKNTLFLSGTLSVKGLRRILTLVEPPTPELAASGGSETATDGTPGSATPGGAEAKASPQKTFEYFKELETLVDDVKTPNPKSVVGTGEVAVWMDRYARKIDQLPILGVDEQLVDFSATIAQAIRDMGVQYRGVGIEASKYSNNAGREGGWNDDGYGYSGGYSGGYWGGYEGDSWEFPHKTLAASTVAKRVGRANVSGNRADLWRQIDDDMSKARRGLTKRYQIEF
ncbi:MAG: hypothetical protein ACYC6Y_03145 [Thermoguttaceae bacterium]